MASSKILIAGAGITGSVIAYELRRIASAIAGEVTLLIWEKNQEIGGRMLTVRPSDDSKCQADVGAQYFSVSPHHRSKYSRLFAELEKQHLLVKMTASIEGGNPYSGNDVEDEVCPLGTAAIVQHFLTQSGCRVRFNSFLARIDRDGKGKLTATNHAGDTEGDLDFVLLTMPPPEIFGLQGTAVDSDVFSSLRKANPVQYSSRFAVALFFPNHSDIGLSFGFKFLDDDVIRYLAVDNVKRGILTDAASVVMHSTWQFGKGHIDANENECAKLMLDRFYQLYPGVPKTDLYHVQKWRYSQVRGRADEANALGYFELSPGIICAGDGFTWSSLDGCFESAMKLSLFMKEKLTKSAVS